MSHFAPDMFCVDHFAPQHWGGLTIGADLQPCDNVVAGGGRGVGVDPEGGNFPFVQPSADLRGLIADAYVAHDLDVELPLSIVWLYGFDKAFCYDDASSVASLSHDPVHDADVEIRDAAGQVVFDSTAAYYFASRNWGTRLRIHEWRTDQAVCRIVQHTAFDDADEVRVFPDEIRPADGRLDERCGHRMHRRVISIGVPGPVDRVYGDGEFVAGYNIVVATTGFRHGLRTGTRLTFSAVAGGGIGRFPGCTDPDPLVRSINGVGPDAAGNFAVAADACYYARQPADVVAGVATPVAATLRVGNDCGPCCDCTDFAEVQKGVLVVWDKLAILAARRTAIQATHEANIARWLEDKACREAQPVRVNAMAHHGSRVEVAVAVCNRTGECAADVVLHVELAAGPGTDAFAVDPLSVYTTDPVAGTRATTLVPTAPVHGGTEAYSVWFDLLPNQASASLRFSVSVTKIAPTVSFTAIGLATVPPDGASSPVSRTVEV